MFESQQINADTLARLYLLAESQNRSVKDIVETALDSYFQSISWLENEVNKARLEMREGKGISHETMKEKTCISYITPIS